MLVQLQYLRAVAALMVVYFHAILQLRNLQPDAVMNGFLLGKSGVDLFFVLSGFVMWITTADRPIGTREFYVRRIVRIAPLYWALTLAAAAAALVIPSALKSTVFDPPHVVASLFFLPWINPADAAGTMIAPVIVPGWTLNYEMYFYLLFGALLGLSKAVRPFALAGLLLAVFGLCRLLPPDLTAARFYGDSVVFEFVIGVFLGKLYLDGRRISAAVAWPLIALAAAAMLWNDWMEWQLPRLLTVGLPAAVVVGSFALLDLSRKPAIGWLSHLGDASFSLYLCHVFVLAGARMVHGWLPFAWMRHEGPFLLFCLLSSTVVAVILHNLFEKPVDRYLRSRRRAPARLSPATPV
ncbi:acyltransferase [Rhizobium sp. TRM95111]|uniref:acyltransferase family protein n=1 Tax=Rhizobium alarense TaxID=2846851 RepID=UPI001F1AEF26|nr:acyltransferase [Rhizobium alarense]MCF3640452.1 acyltransferase [Rhizobium alarense]